MGRKSIYHALIARLIEVSPAFDVRCWIVCGVTFTPQLLLAPLSRPIVHPSPHPPYCVSLTSQEEGLVPKQ